MWFTLILVLDVFLATWIVRFLPSFYVLLLAIVYFMFSLPRSEAFRSWKGWDRFRNPIIVSGEPSRSQAIYAVCPHGIHGEGAIQHFVLSKKDVTMVATSLLFYVPIVREFANLAGAMPANTATIASLLKAGKSIVLMPEGLRGAIHPIGDLSVLRGIPGESLPRKGFIRCAIASKVPIVPVYMAGIDKLYTTYHPFPWLQRLVLSQYYYPWFILNFGWWGSFWPKLDKTIHVRYGKQIEAAGRDVDEVFEAFLDEMEELKR